MKLLILALLTTFSFSSEINWLKYKEALSKQDKKPIFYVLSASYCEFCKKDFVREKSLINHMCEKKRRWLWKDER
jgi:thioredoxin-related protein